MYYASFYLQNVIADQIK